LSENSLLAILVKDQPVTYHPSLARALGSISCSTIISHLMRSEGKNGWIPKRFEDWNNEIGISRLELDAARKKLKRAGIIEERYGQAGAIKYRLDLSVLGDILDKFNNGIVLDLDKKEEKEKKPNRIPALVMAFRARGLKDPIINGHAVWVNHILNDGVTTADDLACCWGDIESGKFGANSRMKEFLSFKYLHNSNILAKWREWKENGEPKTTIGPNTFKLRRGEREDDLAIFG